MSRGRGMELLRGEGEAKEAKAETTWKDGTRGEWYTRGGSYARRAIPWLQGQRKFAVARKRIWWCIVLFFSFFFFRILPVTVISLLFLAWSISFFFLFCSFSVFWLSWWKVVQGAWKGYMQYFRGIFETRFALRTRVWSAD